MELLFTFVGEQAPHPHIQCGSSNATIAQSDFRLFWLFVNFSFTDRLQNDSEENIQTIPTIGFNVEVLQYKNIKFQVN